MMSKDRLTQIQNISERPGLEEDLKVALADLVREVRALQARPDLAGQIEKKTQAAATAEARAMTAAQQSRRRAGDLIKAAQLLQTVRPFVARAIKPDLGAEPLFGQETPEAHAEADAKIQETAGRVLGAIDAMVDEVIK